MTDGKKLTISTARKPSLEPATLEEAMSFAKIIARSGMVPDDYAGKPEACLVALVMGRDLGLSPMQSLQNISVIRGRPCVWGDAMLGIVLAHPDCQGVDETISDDGQTATCTVKRRGRAIVTRFFSVEDARKAGLWGKKGPWATYPQRMLQMRARGFALRDAFADALRGLHHAEEVQDYQPSDIDRPKASRVDTLKAKMIEGPREEPGQAAPAPEAETEIVDADIVSDDAPGEPGEDQQLGLPGSSIDDTVDEYLRRIRDAVTVEDLNALIPAIELIGPRKSELRAPFLDRMAELSAE